MIKFRMTAIAAIIVLGFSGSAFATATKHDWHSRYKAKQEIVQQVISELDLTDEQTVRLEHERNRTFEEKRMLMEQIRQKKNALKEAIAKPRIDHEQVNGLIDEITGLKKVKLRNWVDSLLIVRGILTQQQYETFQTRLHEQEHK